MSRKQSSPGLWVAVAVAALLAAPFIYGLLLGPLAYLCVAKKVSVKTFNSVARPAIAFINYTGGKPHWFWAPTHRYLDWGIERAYDWP